MGVGQLVEATVPITVDSISPIIVEDDLPISVDRPDGPCGAEAAAGANRRRNTGGSDPLRVDPTGGAAPGGPPPRTR